MDNCIFCKIISGEIPSAVIFENDEFKVILDRFPASKGHVLIIPKKHFDNIFDIEPELGGRLFTLAVRMAGIVKKATGAENMNIIQNNGPLAGQTVNHFHLHIIPRYENDSISVKWSQLQLTDDEIEDVRKAIVSKL